VEQRADQELLLQYLTREELQAIVDIQERALARAAAGEKPPVWDEGLNLDTE